MGGWFDLCGHIARSALRMVQFDRRGSVAVQVALVLTVLVGFAALGLEITTLLLQQRKQQAAADAAAIAAGVTGRTTTQLTNEALAMTGNYGFVNGSNSVVVTVNKPATGGTYDANSVEVIVQKAYPARLLKLFKYSSFTIKARAVSAPGRRSSGCLLALDPSASGAAIIRNSSSISNTACELAVNSTSASALVLENNAHILGPVYLMGRYTLGNGASITGTPLTTDGLTAVIDPYAEVTLPTAPACTGQAASFNGTKTINPGHFCSGLSIANNAKITLTTGIYFIDGAFSLGQNSTITGTSGVTILFNSAPTITVSSGVSLSLTAPLTGSTAGMAMTSQRTVTGTFAINNNATMLIEGAMYFPAMTANISGNAQTTGANCTQLIAKKLDLGSNLAFKADCSATAVKPIGRTQPVLIE
ncbi:MAG: hypothetical protein RIQ99_1461 [Pseudomonadota bacterium]